MFVTYIYCTSVNHQFKFLSLPSVNKEHPFRDEAHLFYKFIDLKLESRPYQRWSSSSMLGHSHRHTSTLSHPHPLTLHHARPDGDSCSMEDLTGEKLSNGRPRSGSSFSSSPRSSLSSLLEECFDTIASLAPETLIYATLKME